jgi:hypothetical protein
MKHILFLLALAPALALAQTGTVKDSVRVLTTAEIAQGNSKDSAHLYFIDTTWKKIRMDSLARFARVKLAGDRGDIIVSADGLTWTVDTSAIDSIKLANNAINVAGPKVTGTLPVSKGGTGLSSVTAGRILYGAGTSNLGNSSNFVWDQANLRLGIGTSSPDQTLVIKKSTNSSSGSTFPRMSFENTLATRGVTGSGTFNFADIKISSGADSVQFFLQTSFADGATWFPQANISVVSESTVAAPLVFKNNATGNQDIHMRLLQGGDFLIGYNTDQGAYKLQVNSQIFATNATIATSDARYKENVIPLGGTLDKIMQLKPVSFTFIHDSKNNFSEHEEVGFIAQDVENTFSTESYSRSIVKPLNETDDKSPLGLSETKMIPLLVKAIQEQQAQIEQLKNRIIQLENK